ncbi:cellulose synthase-like protein G2 isoform X2 [Prunus avium]|uniref:Cellulose synthase-like protein G2 isoform X2 n=1 Tax=Prunus avium TaxID=42229 RepID=A0A6P5TXM2_PRUAV|nr:cellulose synthase-like protein G2 isoform X2 [Prunus avium]
MSSNTHGLPLHTHKPSRRTTANRIFAVLYGCATLALLSHHALSLLNSTTLTSFFITLTFLISDSILAFMFATTQSFHMRPIYRKEFPENLIRVVEESEFPALDVFISTADPYKEPPMNVVNTALSVMAYDYPIQKVSVYVSDDGGSSLTLFALMEAAKFARHWLPFCRNNNIVDCSPEAYFAIDRDSHLSDQVENIKVMYKRMEVRVKNVIERGKVAQEYITREEEIQAFSKWTEEFTRQDHPTVIQVLLESNKDKDITGNLMPNLIYVSREKSKTSTHHFKAGALNVLIGVRYGSLVEDYFTGYRLQCEGWKSIFCHPDRAAFYGDIPINLVEVLNQNKRWAIGLLEVAFSKFSPITFGTRAMGPLMGLAYAHSGFWPIWSIPIISYAFLPQLTLLNGLTIFPKVSEPWFLLYVYLFLGAYIQDLLDFVLAGGTFYRWWNDQRMWIIRGLSSYLFGLIEFLLKYSGISTHGFNLTSKVLDEDQRKRYEQGTMEFGVSSPLFVPLTMAAIVNLAAFAWGHVEVFRGTNNNLEGLFVQMFIAGFGVVNCIPIYEAIIFRSDGGKIPRKTSVVATFLAFLLYLAAHVTLRNSAAKSVF